MTPGTSQVETIGPPRPPYDVPAGETPPATCRHCEAPFRSERALALHLGEVHPDDLDEVEATAYERATALERDDLFYYHAKVVGALGALYSVTVIAYLVAFGTGFV